MRQSGGDQGVSSSGPQGGYDRQSVDEQFAERVESAWKDTGGEYSGRAAEGLHPVRRRAASLQLERDLPQRLERIHVRTPTHARPEATAGEPAVHLHRFST